MSHRLKAQDIRLIRKKDTGKVRVCVAWLLYQVVG